MKSTIILAFDQHAATTVAAVLLPGQRTAALHTLTSDSATILRFVERVRRQGAVRCCYEAGPCGFELQRNFLREEVRRLGLEVRFFRWIVGPKLRGKVNLLKRQNALVHRITGHRLRIQRLHQFCGGELQRRSDFGSGGGGP